MRTFWILLVVLASLASAGCEVIGDIFQAGMATGIVIVVLVVAIVGFLITRMRR